MALAPSEADDRLTRHRDGVAASFACGPIVCVDRVCSELDEVARALVSLVQRDDEHEMSI